MNIEDNHLPQISFDGQLPDIFETEFYEKKGFRSKFLQNMAPPMDANQAQHMLFEHLHRFEDIDFLQNGVAKDVYPESRFDGFVDPNSIHSALSAEYSIRIKNICRFDTELALWSQKISKRLSVATEANMYVTSGSKPALKPHQDPHDVLIYQIEGCKQWHVQRPLEHQPELPIKASILPITTPLENPLVFCMQPGDFLYLPRGYLHHASWVSGLSIHLTFRIVPVKWQDLFQSMLELGAQNNLDIRRGVSYLNGTAQENAMEAFMSMFKDENNVRIAFANALRDVRLINDDLMKMPLKNTSAILGK